MATILIVDDRPSNREYLATLLGYGGHRLLQAGDGAEALGVVRSERPDLVIADILMPTMDGYEFVRQLRAEPDIANTRVIFFTAHYHEQEARTLANACGVGHVLTKPCEPEVVLQTVQAALGALPIKAAAAVELSEEQFDREHARVLTDKLSQKADALRRANERLSALIALGLQLGSERHPRRLLQSFCHAAREIIGARHAIVGVVDGVDNPLRHLFTSGMDAATAVRLGSPHPRQGPLRHVLAESRCVRLENPQGDPTALELSAAYPPIHSWLAAPIVSLSGVYGWLALIDKIGAAAFSEEDERLAATLAAQVGRIYENGSMYLEVERHAANLEREIAERQRAEQRQSILLAASEELAASSTLQEAARRVLAVICARLGWQVASIWMVDRQAPLLHCIGTWHSLGAPGDEWAAAIATITFAPGEGLPGRVWQTGQPAWIADVAHDPQFVRAPLASRCGLRAGFAFPILLDKQVLGVVDFFSNGFREPDQDLLQVFTGISGYLGQFMQRKQAEASLQESEEHLRRAIENAPIPIMIHSDDGKILQLNKAWTEITGYSREELPTIRAWVEKAYGERADQVEAVIKHLYAMQLGSKEEGEYHVRTRSGATRFWVFRSAALGRLSSGRRLVISTAMDITDRQAAEQSLAERARLATLFGDIGVALTQGNTLREILHKCAESLVRRLDAAFARIWTVNHAEAMLELQASAGMYTHLDGSHARVPIGQLKIGMIARERRPHLSNDVLGDPRIDEEWARREGLVAFAGYPLLVADRVEGVMALFARQPLSDAAVQAMAAVADQIAVGIVRKREEQARAHAQQRLEEVIASSPAVLYTLAVSDHDIIRCVWMSDNVTLMLGYTVAETSSPEWWPSNVHPDDRDQTHAKILRELFTQNHSLNEYRFRHKDGKYRWVRSEMRLIRDAAGKPLEAIGSWSDISEHKLLEDQFRQSQKMEAFGRLAGGVAHDFNNLLTVICGYSEIAVGTLPGGDPLRDMLDQIRKAGDRATSLTRQLLAFSRKQVLQPVVLSLNTLLLDMDKMLRRLIGEDIDLMICPFKELWSVKADAGQMEQVVMNLVVNARDAMPQGGKLTIETANVDFESQHNVAELPPGSYALLAVSDTGIGMDEAVQSRIFEPFFTTKGPEKGTGLGLATVWGIIKQSGGHVSVYSEVSLGTTFKIYLPAIDASVQAESAAASLTAPLNGTETILLVEDEEGVRALARLVLQSHGYTVLEARNGGEALVLAQQHRGIVNMMVTDVVMPNMSGRQLAERLQPLHPDMRVLYLSGYTDDAVVRHGIIDARIPFLQKPFSPLAFARKVREVLDKKPD